MPALSRNRSSLPLIVVLVVFVVALIVALLPEDTFGRPSGRIINGTSVSADRQAQMWPFLVSIGNRGYTARSSHFCGGSIISETLVLTAAHCMDELTQDGNMYTLPRSITVLAGVPVLSDEANGQRRGVKAIYVYPKWNVKTGVNDLALIRLATPFTFNDHVKPISVIDDANSAWWGNGAGHAADPATGSWSAGWGNIVAWDKKEAYPNGLFEVNMPIADDASCVADDAPGMGNIGTVGISTTQFLCAGEPDSDDNENNGSTGHDTCQGDSGGPLVVGDGAGAWQQLGIVSYGSSCGAVNYGAYTRLPTYHSWINQALASSYNTGIGGTNPAGVGRMTRSYRTSAIISWNAPVGGASSYVVYGDAGDGALLRYAATTRRTMWIKGLDPASYYYIYVAARDSFGNEAPLRRITIHTRR